MKEYIVGELDGGQRLDKYLSKILSQAPKSFLYKMLRKKNIVLNNKKAAGNETVKAQDVIRFYLSDETFTKFQGQAFQKVSGDLQVIFENRHILLVNKPAGLLSQKSKPSDVSLVDKITSYYLNSGYLEEESLQTFKPGICNRLDRNTSGIIAAGKTLEALQILSQMFKDRTIHKFYLCVVCGVIPKEQLVKGYLTKDKKSNKVIVTQSLTDEAKPIETKYFPISSNGKFTLCKVALITGRSHQIRAHLASVGHPIVGDGKYGNKKVNEICYRKYGIKYQLLHGWNLLFPHMNPDILGVSGKAFYSGIPDDFAKFLLQERIAKEESIKTWEKKN